MSKQQLGCEGFRKLLAAVERDEIESPRFHDYRGKLEWAVSRAKHYAEKTGLAPETILDAWESKRDYWYMNYYQPANQPLIADDSVRVFGTVEGLRVSIGDKGFRCPACAGVSKSPYECDTGIKKNGKVCDWKSYGLLGHLGKGISVFVTEKVQVQAIFMPVAWEQNEKAVSSPICGCVWMLGVRPFPRCCEAQESGDWYCARPSGHDGEHVACSPGKHNIHRWPNNQAEP